MSAGEYIPYGEIQSVASVSTSRVMYMMTISRRSKSNEFGSPDCPCLNESWSSIWGPMSGMVWVGLRCRCSTSFALISCSVVQNLRPVASYVIWRINYRFSFSFFNSTFFLPTHKQYTAHLLSSVLQKLIFYWLHGGKWYCRLISSYLQYWNI